MDVVPLVSALSAGWWRRGVARRRSRRPRTLPSMSRSPRRTCRPPRRLGSTRSLDLDACARSCAARRSRERGDAPASSSGAADVTTASTMPFAARVEAPELRGRPSGSSLEAAAPDEQRDEVARPPCSRARQGAGRAARSRGAAGIAGLASSRAACGVGEALLGGRRALRARHRSHRRARRSRRPPPRSGGRCCASAPCVVAPPVGHHVALAAGGRRRRRPGPGTRRRAGARAVAVHRLPDDLARGQEGQVGHLAADLGQGALALGLDVGRSARSRAARSRPASPRRPARGPPRTCAGHARRCRWPRGAPRPGRPGAGRPPPRGRAARRRRP